MSDRLAEAEIEWGKAEAARKAFEARLRISEEGM